MTKPGVRLPGALAYYERPAHLPWSARDATLVTAANTNDLFVNALEVFVPAVDVVTAGR